MRASLLLALGLLLLLPACKKEPGVGGKAIIKGFVMRQNVNALGIPQGAPYPYQDTRVFIVYGDGTFPDNDVRTGPDGNFEFRWLLKGKYTVFTYGECDCPGHSTAISQTVTITGRKDEVVVPTFTANNY